jgi:hypothetical protein
MTFALGSIEALSVYSATSMAFPSGIVQWSDVGGVLVWFVLIAFLGSMLGMLRQQTSGHRTGEGNRAPLTDARLRHAA